MKRGLAGLGIVVLLAACGGGGGTTKADYVAKANAVCRQAAKEVAALHLPAPDDVASTPKVAAKVVVVQRSALERLQGIKAPKQDRAEIAKWIALVDQTIDQAEMSAQSQKDGDIKRAVTANVNGAALDHRADELARSYGLRGCVAAAQPPTDPTTSTTKSGA